MKIRKMLIVGAMLTIVSGWGLVPVMAQDYGNGWSNNGTTGIINGSRIVGRGQFLGLVPWDWGVEDKITKTESKEDLEQLVIGVVLNIATNLTVIAAYLTIVFVIYGGYLYMFSGGDVGKVTTGKKTLLTAFIGLAIVILTNVIFGTIRIVLSSGSSGSGGVFNLPNVNATEMVSGMIQWVIGIGGILAAIFVVYGGILYMTSAGDAGKITKAKQTIMYALIGLAIVGLAELLTAFVSSMIRSAAQNNINETIIISKGGQ